MGKALVIIFNKKVLQLSHIVVNFKKMQILT